MKKVFAIALAVVMLLSVVLGCTGKKKETPPAAPGTTVTQNQENRNGNVAGASDKIQQKDSKQQKQTSEKINNPGDASKASEARVKVEKGKAYTDKEHVAAYIHVYKTLPPNYITKGQAGKLGWKTKGTLDKVAPGKSIGGDRFNNYEKVLPDKQGRTWKECDIDYVKGNRNAKRICFSNDGLIYYSGSHYRDFVRLY